MKNFFKLNRLHLISTMGALVLFSTELSADCDVGRAINSLLVKAHTTICTGWPSFSNPHATSEDDCVDCLSDIYRECEVLGTHLSDDQHTFFYNRCFKLQGSKHKKNSLRQKFHTP